MTKRAGVLGTLMTAVIAGGLLLPATGGAAQADHRHHWKKHSHGWHDHS